MKVIGLNCLSPSLLEIDGSEVKLITFVETSEINVNELVNTIRSIEGVLDVRYVVSEFLNKGYCFDEFYYPITCGDFWRMIVIVSDRFIEAMSTLRDKLGTALDAILYHIGYWYGYTSAENMKRVLSPRSFLTIVRDLRMITKYFIHIARVCGWVQLELIKI